MYGYSNFMHILSEKPKINSESTFVSILNSGFAPKLQMDYSFQHRYRITSVKIFFFKELISGFIILMTSMVIYFDYLTLFRGVDVYFRP